MVMDMPPGQAVEYHMEAPAPAILSANGLENILRVARARRVFTEVENGQDASKILPRIDPASKALTDRDRRSLADGITAGPYGRDEKSASAAPASYVGDRVRLAALRAQALEQSFQGNLKREQAEALRCRTIAVAMDKRAGSYVMGGERAAEMARNAISPEAIAKCREAVAQRSRPTEVTRSPVSISPERPRAAVPQRIDLVGTERQRIDPVGSVRQRIDPVGSVRHRLDLSSGAGRGG